jgi:hypothetical protein
VIERGITPGDVRTDTDVRLVRELSRKEDPAHARPRGECLTIDAGAFGDAVACVSDARHGMTLGAR